MKKNKYDYWPRTLIFTYIAPPSSRAAAQVTERLLEGIPEGRFAIIHSGQSDGTGANPSGFESYPVGSLGVLMAHIKDNWHFSSIAWYKSAVLHGLKVTENRSFDCILGWYPDTGFTLAAATVAAIRKIPLVLYFDDIYTERPSKIDLMFARLTEPLLLRQSKKLICLTQSMKEYYSARRGIEGVVIPHSVKSQDVVRAEKMRPPLEVNPPLTITYAGGVYQPRLDSLLAVKEAVGQLNREGMGVKLYVLGKNDPERLAYCGLKEPYVLPRYIEDSSQFMNFLRDSDILLSTVAFRSPHPRQDRTCFPTKTFDYFLAGKPVLVVAPPKTEYARYMRKHRCAMVVESLNCQDIIQGIHRLVKDSLLRTKFVNEGFARLKAHQETKLQTILLDILCEAVEKVKRPEMLF